MNQQPANKCEAIVRPNARKGNSTRLFLRSLTDELSLAKDVIGPFDRFFPRFSGSKRAEGRQESSPRPTLES
jgi:hypothetical protein